MKLEVGMYVRSKVNGLIGKIANIEELVNEKDILYYELEQKGSGYGFCSTEINSVKSSYNIIDLIEVRDYANGYYVSKIWEKDEITHYLNKTPIKRKEREIVIQAPSYGGIEILKNEDIKSIITHEQMEQMTYKVGE